MKLDVRVTAKAHNAHLARLVDRYENQTKAAEALGIPVAYFCDLINFKRLPRHEDKNYTKAFLLAVEKETGHSFEEVFPDIPDEAMLKTLSYRERTILRMRFGLDGPAKTLQEVGNDLGVTGTRIREIEAMAMRKLQQPSRAGVVIECL